MKIKTLLCSLAVGLLLAGCKTPQLGYFQDLKNGDKKELTSENIIKLQPGDRLSILVSSKDPNLAYLYNLQVVGHYRSTTSNNNLSTSSIASYTVDEDGCIDFPYLGKLHIQGMTRSQVAEFVKASLIKNDMLKDPTVTVDFRDMYFSVTGEVKNPGRFVIDHDKVTILDALSQAGDLTIYGRRDNVLVMRQEGKTQNVYRIDLANADQLYSSPVFYLQQNDVIYVEPNTRRAKEATELGVSFSNPSLWLSAASLLTTISVLIFKN